MCSLSSHPSNRKGARSRKSGYGTLTGLFASGLFNDRISSLSLNRARVLNNRSPHPVKGGGLLIW